jgi:hypothetical protein
MSNEITNLKATWQILYKKAITWEMNKDDPKKLRSIQKDLEKLFEKIDKLIKEGKIVLSEKDKKDLEKIKKSSQSYAKRIKNAFYFREVKSA